MATPSSAAGTWMRLRRQASRSTLVLATCVVSTGIRVVTPDLRNLSQAGHILGDYHDVPFWACHFGRSGRVIKHVQSALRRINALPVAKRAARRHSRAVLHVERPVQERFDRTAQKELKERSSSFEGEFNEMRGNLLRVSNLNYVPHIEVLAITEEDTSVAPLEAFKLHLSTHIQGQAFAKVTDPWNCQIIPNKNCEIRMNTDVVHVYENYDNMVAEKPMDLSYASLPQFIDDFELIGTVISDLLLRPSRCHRLSWESIRPQGHFDSKPNELQHLIPSHFLLSRSGSWRALDFPEVDDVKFPPYICRRDALYALGYWPDSTDIVISSYPGAGSSWIVQIVYLLIHNGHLGDITYSFTHGVSYLEAEGEAVESYTKPRIIKTHLGFENIIYTASAKYIYIGASRVSEPIRQIKDRATRDVLGSVTQTLSGSSVSTSSKTALVPYVEGQLMPRNNAPGQLEQYNDTQQRRTSIISGASVGSPAANGLTSSEPAANKARADSAPSKPEISTKVGVEGRVKNSALGHSEDVVRGSVEGASVGLAIAGGRLQSPTMEKDFESAPRAYAKDSVATFTCASSEMVVDLEESASKCPNAIRKADKSPTEPPVPALLGPSCSRAQDVVKKLETPREASA
ncbi:hypothetical protein HPB52_005531 [Rhipicephalus sanguineus]|uniref:Sulfotransferase domain-containing protein n=1 Tax=Rhipicephalus sanguineus TaxID=34632 RepID=A0A9D4Q4S9_RHISA|nr:hypothetical protein HPB52_005531 [Rhipicephalus sanguineus]